MATAADIGANFSDYKGDPFLGGANEGIININTQPLMQLAQFTFYSKRDKWQKQQQDTDAKIRELADISKIALNDLRAKDRDQMTNEFAQLVKDGQDYISKIPKNEKERLQNELDWQVKRGKFNNNFGSGKARALKFEKEKNVIIEKYPNNLKAQEIAIKALEKKFDESDISTPISDVNIFTVEKPELPKALTHTIHKVAMGPNHDVAVDMTYFNPISNPGLAWASANGVSKLNVPKTIIDSSGKVVANPEYESQKEYQDIQATGEGQAEIWAAMAEPINEVLRNYVKDDVFDEIGFRKAVKGNLVLSPILEAIDAVNEYKRVKQEQISQGMFKDDTGKQFALPTDIKAEDFDRMGIDLSKGNITPDKLALAGIFAEYNGDVITKKLTENDNAIQREQLRISLGHLGLEREKMNKANTQSLLAADGIIREVTDIINIGDTPENQVKVVDPSTGKEKMVFEISDPTVLQKFGNVDKEGNVTNVADRLRFNKKTNELELVYFSRDDADQIIETKTGHKIRDIKPLNARTWVNMVVQRSGSGQDRGEINEIVQSVITKNGGDLYKIAKKLNTAPTTQPEAAKKGGGMSDAQYQEFLNKNGLK